MNAEQKKGYLLHSLLFYYIAYIDFESLTGTDNIVCIDVPGTDICGISTFDRFFNRVLYLKFSCLTHWK